MMMGVGGRCLLISPKMDVRSAPVLDAIICCVGEMASTASARSPILPSVKHSS